MSVLDFLFEGKPPTSVTTYGSTTENLPQWMSDYTQGLIAKANQVGAQAYQPYSGPRIAALNSDQQKAEEMTRSSVGIYQPWLAQAGALTQAAGAINAPGAAQPYMDQAAKRLPGNVQEYMDPYVGNVIDRAKLEANRNFEEKIQPRLNNQFTSAGQYGSSAHMREADRAARDLTEGLQSTSLGALSQAYQQASGQFQTDQGRQAQLASTAGNLAAAQANTGLEAGRQSAALGEASQALGMKDAGALSAIGAEQQQQQQRNLDLAYGDFQAQRDFPKQNVDWLSQVIRGMPQQTTTTKTETGLPPPGTTYGPSTVESIGSLITAGKGIYDIFQGNKARGGAVRRYAKGGLVRPRRPGALHWVTV